MKPAIIILASLFLMSSAWRTDFSNAKTEAAKEHKLILLKFSGSDWCIPCIKLEKSVFSQSRFISFADSNLIMVNADFPRLKKNNPGIEVARQNEVLAEQYDKDGHFPLTLLLDANGKVLMRWDGNPGLSPEDFIRQIKNIQHAD